ncbi:A disintegrin and metalloproteinase with thrombospondin motifs 10-like [Clytia hemisphaerica]
MFRKLSRSLLIIEVFLIPFTTSVWSQHLWKLQSWTPCSRTCQGGSKKAVFGCFDILQEKFVNERFCTEYTKFHLEKACNYGIHCQASILRPQALKQYEGYWFKSEEFGQCTTTCGRGVRSRPVMCISRTELKMLDDSKCPADEKPIGSILCGNKECPVIADWKIGNWSECSSTTCDGIQTRTVICQKEGGEETLHRHCEKKRPKPIQERICSPPCAVWVVGSWGKCRYNAKLKKCSDAKQTRCVTCVDRRTMQVSDRCSLDQKPSLKRNCTYKDC